MMKDKILATLAKEPNLTSATIKIRPKVSWTIETVYRDDGPPPDLGLFNRVLDRACALEGNEVTVDFWTEEGRWSWLMRVEETDFVNVYQYSYVQSFPLNGLLMPSNER